MCDLIRSAAATGLALAGDDLSLSLMTDEELGDVMLDWLQFGEKEPEGILAILYRALWAMAELRERLKLYEDICFAEDGTELLSPWALRVLREARENLRNDPLTLEELRGMDGKPVYLGTSDFGEWVLVRLEESDVYFLHKNTICAPAKIAFDVGMEARRRMPEAPAGTP